MCGICGIYSADADHRAALVPPMLEALRHRGPDDSAWEAREGCVLGSRRLRVIDLEQGDQPVANEAGDVVCVFNGELYNFPELRRELEARGHTVKGHGDTAVIPHLYEEHGVEFVERLEGMFAIALYSARERRLVLARDRLGKKPLVLTRLADGALAFASELKAFTTVPGFSGEPDLAALDAYLALGYIPGDRTGLRGVRRLPPAHRLVVDDRGERLER
jgi:asparagine synthase (glutamine-hydrolysing)